MAKTLPVDTRPLLDPALMRPSRSAEAPPIYHQVYLGIEAVALAQPQSDAGPLPTESMLAEWFGVSRGTVRRAIDGLIREGLLRTEPGRGTFVDKRTQVRRTVRDQLGRVAYPDSRFHLDVSRFVPDFDGSQRCETAVRALAAYDAARVLFVAPDNSLEGLRRTALADRKTVLVPTYGLRRGMVRLAPAQVRAAQRELAATLDGMERVGEALDLDALADAGPVDLLVTGATAVTRDGVHVGSGDAYLDLEWGILAELGLVHADTPVVAVVHSCQVIESGLAPDRGDLTVDVIVTPEATTPTHRTYPRPTGLAWEELTHDRVDAIAYLAALGTRSRLFPSS